MKNQSPKVGVLGQPVYYPGYMFGLDQPCLVAHLGLPDDVQLGEDEQQQQLLAMDEILRLHAPPSDEVRPGNSGSRTIDYLLFWTRCLLDYYRQPVLREPYAARLSGAEAAHWRVILPCLDRTPVLASLNIVIKALSLTYAPSSRVSLESSFHELIRKNEPHLKTNSVNGFNMPHLLKHAHRLGIPWFRYLNGTFQLGQGRRSRLLESSITDATPNISVKFARNKEQCHAILRQAGVPVPAQILATTADDAVAAATKLGFPVVVKPSDMDGGAGVSAFLHDEKSVRVAFGIALEKSKKILVEKYIEGKDYRIQVVNGVVHGVLERGPGGVRGDGQHAVHELLERQNIERATATDERRFLHRIEPDQEAERMLAFAGLHWQSVPAPGEFVRLRGAANVASGGIPRELVLDEVHPDNLSLAIRTSRILRLDVAGIDLLIPDIGRSWMACDAAICEVNAQPQMFTTMHEPLLLALLPENRGRIPCIVVLPASGKHEFSKALYDQLLAIFPNAGLVTNSAVMIAGTTTSLSERSIFAGTRSLLIDRSVDALLISATGDDLFKTGWPIDRCDALLIVGTGNDVNSSAAATQLQRLASLACALKPLRVLIDFTKSECLSAARQVGWLDSHCQPVNDAISTADPADLDSVLTSLLTTLPAPVRTSCAHDTHGIE